MPKNVKGKRPIYLDGSQTDKLLEIVMTLVGEVSVLRDRLDTIERLVETKDILSREEIEAYQPDDVVLREREEWRSQYLERVLQAIEKQ